MAKGRGRQGQDAVDERLMDAALRAGARGRPSPNPHVGAVVARRGEVVATGHHRKAGEAHAEVAALERAGRRARGATLYVTFEPCNHFGRTPPCTDAIIEAGIRRVVIGCADPAPHVRGATRKLRRAGIEVKVGVHRDRAHALIADFEKHITTGLPFVTLKAAVTLDGRIATRTGDSRWITGERARVEAHRLRDRSDAVLVGVGTVLADDCSLTVRHVRGRDPLRAVLDTRLRTPPEARILTQASRASTLIFHGPDAPRARRRRLGGAGAELVEVPVGADGHVQARAVMAELGRRDVVRLLVEGGAAVSGALLDAGLVDRVAVFLAPRIVGDAEAVPMLLGRGADRIAEAWRIRAPEVRRLGEDLLVRGDLIRAGE